MRKHRQRKAMRLWAKRWGLTYDGQRLGWYHTQVTRARMHVVYEQMIENDKEGA